MPSVGRSSPHVVDWARGGRDPLRKPAQLRESRGDEPRHGPGRPERRPNLIALSIDRQRQRDDGDHHRVPRPDLHERLRPAANADSDADDELVLRQRVPLRPGQELGERHRPLTANTCQVDDRLADQQRRQSVAGR